MDDKRFDKKYGVYSSRADLIAAIKHQHEQGIMQKNIASVVGVSYATVSRILSEEINIVNKPISGKEQLTMLRHRQVQLLAMFNKLWRRQPEPIEVEDDG